MLREITQCMRESPHWKADAAQRGAQRLAYYAPAANSESGSRGIARATALEAHGPRLAEAQMFQARIHGRGGQGAVTAADLMAIAAFHNSRHSLSFPSFGSERMAAPVTAFVRIDDRGRGGE